MRKKINFTKATLLALPLPLAGQRETYHDLKTNGLQIRITSSGVKTFSVFQLPSDVNLFVSQKYFWNNN